MSNKKRNKNFDATTFSKRNFYSVQDSSWLFLICLLLPLLTTLIFLIVMQSIALNTGAMTAEDSVSVIYGEPWFSIPYTIFCYVVYVAIYFFFHRARKISFSATKISVKKANIWTCLLCAIAAIVCVLGFMWLIEGCFGSLFRILGVASDESNSVSLPYSNFGWLILNYLLMGIVPAVCEELLFRGVIFKGLKNKFSTVWAVVLSALLFALMHQSIDQLIYPFVIGVFLALIMEGTNNLLYCMIFHAFNNCTTLTITYLMENNLISLDFSASWMVSWWGILIAIALAAITVVLLFLLWKFHLKKHKKLEEEKAENTEDSGKMVGKMPLVLVVGLVTAVVLLVINCIPSA